MKPLAILLDFDGTITNRDVGDLVVRRFALPGWESGMPRFERGEMTLRQVWVHEAAHLRASDHAAMARFAIEIATLRPGLPDLLAFAQEASIPVEVASSGFGFYIRGILENAGITGLSVASPELEFGHDGTGRVLIHEDVGDCGTTAMCKCSRVKRMQERGHRVLFVGDGASDFCVASESEHLMARTALARHCESNGIPYTPFETFFDVIEEARRLMTAHRPGRDAGG